MALMHCKECSAEISSTANTCPKCGARLKRSKVWLLFIPIIAIALFLSYGAYINASRTPEQRLEARAVSLCYEMVKKGSPLYSGIADCVSMRSDYYKKWGENP